MLVTLNNKKEYTLSQAKTAKTLRIRDTKEDTKIISIDGNDRNIIGLITSEFIIIRHGIKISKTLNDKLNEIYDYHFKDITNEGPAHVNNDLLFAANNEDAKKEAKKVANKEHKEATYDTFREILLDYARHYKSSSNQDISIKTLAGTIISYIPATLDTDYEYLINMLNNNIVPSDMRLNKENIDTSIINYKTLSDDNIKDIISLCKIIDYTLNNSSKSHAKKVSNMTLSQAKKDKKILSDKIDLDKQMIKIVGAGMNISQDIKEPINNVA